MKFRCFSSSLAIAIALAAYPLSALAQSAPAPTAAALAPTYAERRPNVLVWMIDDVGFAQVSSFGGLVDTPNIDRVAQMGLRYANYHTAPMCSPSRAAFLTGRKKAFRTQKHSQMLAARKELPAARSCSAAHRHPYDEIRRPTTVLPCIASRRVEKRAWPDQNTSSRFARFEQHRHADRHSEQHQPREEAVPLMWCADPAHVGTVAPFM